MTGSMPSFSAVTACGLPNSALVEVSEPVAKHAQPAEQRAGEEGWATPVVATA